MNIIFLDFEGVLSTWQNKSCDDIEEKIKILAGICKEYDCKVVIESSYKDLIDNNYSSNNEYVSFILNAFQKYGIECVGKTPNIVSDDIISFKLLEISQYLEMHPEIEHYCIIDDGYLGDIKLDKYHIYNHLIKTVNYCSNKIYEGLLRYHVEEVRNKLKYENLARRLTLKN